jgi:hypothetical protein
VDSLWMCARRRRASGGALCMLTLYGSVAQGERVAVKQLAQNASFLEAELLRCGYCRGSGGGAAARACAD